MLATFLSPFMPSSLHAFSVDVEDWYQGVWIPMEEWRTYPSRLKIGMNRLECLFQRHNVRATCFILGKVAEEHPLLVRDLYHAGHEIATHGWSHKEVTRLTPDTFRDEIRRSVDLLEDITGERVLGYRAPFFTITRDTLFALDILQEEGLRYDSSIHPILHHRCGIADAPRTPTYFSLKNGNRLLEIPVSTFPVGKYNLPMGGGAYFRLYPSWLSRRAMRRLAQQGEHLSLYIHPWELDPDYPELPLAPLLRFVRRVNLSSTLPKLEQVFEEFAFAPYATVYRSLILPDSHEPVSAYSGGRTLHPEAARPLSLEAPAGL